MTPTDADAGADAARAPSDRDALTRAIDAARDAAGLVPIDDCPLCAAAPLGPTALVCSMIQYCLRHLIDIERERDIGSALGISARHLRRLAAELAGVTPAGLVRAGRAHLARELIVGTNLTVTSIAYAAGFGSPRQLNRAVTAHTGTTPTGLRRGYIDDALFDGDGDINGDGVGHFDGHGDGDRVSRRGIVVALAVPVGTRPVTSLGALAAVGARVRFELVHASAGPATRVNLANRASRASRAGSIRVSCDRFSALVHAVEAVRGATGLDRSHDRPHRG